MMDKKNHKNFTDINAKGWVAHFPKRAQPYILLARLDRPIGAWLLFFPALSALMLAALYGKIVLLPIFYYGLLFFIGAFVMRAAGCVINDLWDRDIDQKVERTAIRPLASGIVSVSAALIFLGFLLLIGLFVLLQFNRFTVALGFVSLIPVVLYPLAKRYTNWPQLILGLTFNWGALMGWAAATGQIAAPAVLFYFSCVFWTLGYDTIYAYQDIKDDKKIGVRSTAILFGDQGKKAAGGFYLLSLLFFAFAAQSLWVCLPMIHLVWQLKNWRVDDQQSCLRMFKANRDTGLLFFLSIVLAYASGY